MEPSPRLPKHRCISITPPGVCILPTYKHHSSTLNKIRACMHPSCFSFILYHIGITISTRYVSRCYSVKCFFTHEWPKVDRAEALQRMVPMQTAAGGTKLRVCVAFATHTYMTYKCGYTDRCIHTYVTYKYDADERYFEFIVVYSRIGLVYIRIATFTYPVPA